jgi:hypothetical protein
MKIKHLVIGTLIHLALFVGFLFLNLGASIGYGFKDSATTLELTYIQFSRIGMIIVRGPLNLIGDYALTLSPIVQVLLVLLNSVVFVVIILWLNNFLKSRNAI